METKFKKLKLSVIAEEGWLGSHKIFVGIQKGMSVHGTIHNTTQEAIDKYNKLVDIHSFSNDKNTFNFKDIERKQVWNQWKEKYKLMIYLPELKEEFEYGFGGTGSVFIMNNKDENKDICTFLYGSVDEAMNNKYYDKKLSAYNKYLKNPVTKIKNRRK